MAARAIIPLLILTVLLGMLTCGPQPVASEGVPNTTITSPANNSHVSGMVTIWVQVESCNCTGTTSLFVDGKFVNNGTARDWKMIEGKYYDMFYHKWDSLGAKEGRHTIFVTGKHSQYSDTIFVTVGEPGTDSGLFVMMGMMSGIIVMTAVAAYFIMLRNRMRKPG